MTEERGTGEHANQDGRHLVWVVLVNTEEGRQAIFPAHGCCHKEGLPVEADGD